MYSDSSVGSMATTFPSTELATWFSRCPRYVRLGHRKKLNTKPYVNAEKAVHAAGMTGGGT